MTSEGLLHDLDDRVGVATLVCSGLFFFAINSLFIWLGQSVTSLRPLVDWRCRNLAVSWVHAVISATGCGYCYIMYWEHLENLGNLVDYKTYPSYLFVAVSFAYFVHDMADFIKEKKALESWEVLAHHVAVLITFGYNLWFQTCIAYAIVALLTEVNSVFLHARKLMQMFRVPFSHWVYRIVVVVNLLTFVVFRGLALSLIIVGLAKYSHKISTFYFWALTFSMTIMVAINPVLLWRLIKSDVLRGLIKEKRTRQGEGAGRNGDLTAVNGVCAQDRPGDQTVSQKKYSKRKGKLS